MLPPYDLNVDILIVIFMQCGDGERVADPEVYGVWGGGESDA